MVLAADDLTSDKSRMYLCKESSTDFFGVLVVLVLECLKTFEIFRIGVRHLDV